MWRLTGGVGMALVAVGAQCRLASDGKLEAVSPEHTPNQLQRFSSEPEAA